MRITGQLIDAATGAHLWADRFDGELEDIFDLQDQVTASVVGAIAPKLEQAEIERAKRKPTESLDAYDYYLRGMAAVHQWTREGNEKALAMFRRAVELDPDFAAAYGMAARCYAQRKGSGWMVDVAAEIAEAERYARRAAILGRDDAIALCAAGLALALVVGDIDAGADLTERSTLINPNLATAWLFSSWVNVWKGEPEVAIEHAARAVRLSPYDPQIFNMQAATAMAHLLVGRYAEASSWADRAVRGNPQHLLAACAAAASCALADRPKEAQKAMAHLRAIAPALRISNLKNLTQLRRAERFRHSGGGAAQGGASRMTANRKLAAILAADVVGFSTMMQADEAGHFGCAEAAPEGGPGAARRQAPRPLGQSDGRRGTDRTGRVGADSRASSARSRPAGSRSHDRRGIARRPSTATGYQRAGARGGAGERQRPLGGRWVRSGLAGTSVVLSPVCGLEATVVAAAARSRSPPSRR